MDAPPVQYARTSDGYSIAYTVSGEGVPFVFMPAPSNHVQLSWTPGSYLQPLLSGLSRRFRLIHYDGRGQGMSSRGLTHEYSLAAMEHDLQAVVDRLKLGRFVLLGANAAGHAAIRFASTHPEHVRALILACCSVSGHSWPVINAVDLAANWSLFPGVYQAAMRAPTAEQRQMESEHFRLSVTQPDWLIMARAWIDSNVESRLACLATPTLILHPMGYENMLVERSEESASKIPGARLVLINGILEWGDADAAIQAIEYFLAEIATTPPEDDAVREYRLSPRQREVLNLIAEGKTTREIAEVLVLSERTVERHIADAYAKIGVRNRSEATAFLLRQAQSG